MADEDCQYTRLQCRRCLDALQRLDNALQATGRAFQHFGGDVGHLQRPGSRGPARRCGPGHGGGQSVHCHVEDAERGGCARGPGGGAGGIASFWLPPGMEAEAKRLDAALASAARPAADAGGKIKTGMDEAARTPREGHAATRRSSPLAGRRLSRVVMTQIIVRAMSQIRDALHEAVEESIEFQRQIAEIQTIAPQTRRQLRASLTSEAAEFAKQFNVPLAQATEGLYQTISDQFTGMSDRANVMTAAMKLAKVGVMDFQDAITADYRHA